MPHIHLYTSADLVENVDIPDILRALVAELSEQETVDPRAIKAYHSLCHTWTMGEGAPSGFVHCAVSILSGRPDGIKKTIADSMYARLRACFKTSVDAGEASPTLELRGMDKDTYRK